MKKHSSIVVNTLLFLHFLLAFLLFFEARIQIPFWVQPLGRMHPLILHFPVAFVSLLVLLNLFKKQLDLDSYHKINIYLLWLTSVSTAIATLMGLILSIESNSSELLTLHKWIGVGISFMLFIAVLVKENKYVFSSLIYLSFISIIFAGHYGASLTHGTNFISEPIISELTPKETNHTVYQNFIQPVILDKCASCHNSQKQKGGLNLSTLEGIKTGGKNGKLWEAHSPEESAFLKRVALPKENKKHMPPEGKPQLSKKEIDLIKLWIAEGADANISYSNLAKNSALEKHISKNWIQKGKTKKHAYTFSFADSKIIESLNDPYRTAVQKSPKSPAIDVTVFGKSKFKIERLSELEKIKNQITYLNLSNLPIEQKDLAIINKFSNLEKLILNTTNIKDNPLESLSNCKKLQSISVANTGVNYSIETSLENFKNLTEIFIWNTNISSEETNSLKTKFGEINFIEGYQEQKKSEYELAPPILLSKGNIINGKDTIQIGHKLNGAIIRYTLDNSTPNKNSDILPEYISMSLEGTRKKTLKTIASKAGWKDSKVKSFTFYSKGIYPDSFKVTYEGFYGEYTGKAAEILIDNYVLNSQKIISSKYWTGFNKEPLIAIASFENSKQDIQEIVLSCGFRSRWNKKLNPKKSPLKIVEIWSSTDNKNWQLDSKTTFPKFKFVNKKTVSIKVNNKSHRYFKIIARPEEKLTFYVNQVFFY